MTGLLSNVIYVLDLLGDKVWTVDHSMAAYDVLGKNGYAQEILLTEEHKRIGSSYRYPMIRSFPDRSCLVVEAVGDEYAIKHKDSGYFLKVTRYIKED